MRITALNPSFVGFDELFNEIERMIEGTQPSPSFPPHNIIKVDRSEEHTSELQSH